MPTLKQWQSAWQALNVAAPKQLFHELIARYSEEHRHYHTSQHLDDCLSKFQKVKNLANKPAEIEIALWFHDAVYNPLRHDNEQLSADWAQSCLLKLNINEQVITRIYELIMFTRHNTQPLGIDAEILVDVDLSILAASPHRFAEYDQQIRCEYAHVSDVEFNKKRSDVLQAFLDRRTIFNTPHFIERYESAARLNLTQALERLHV